LALGELTRGGEGFFPKRFLVVAPFEVFPHLPVAHGAHARHRGVEAILFLQAVQLVDQTHYLP